MRHSRQSFEALKSTYLLLTVATLSCAAHDWAWGATNTIPAKGGGGVAALVNGEPVTRDELRRMVAERHEPHELSTDRGREKTQSTEEDRLALQKLIGRRLMLQEARRGNVQVSEQDVDGAVMAVRRRFADLQSFGAWMSERGLGEKTLLETIRADLLVARVTAALVSGARASDEQIQQYYDTHKSDLKTEEVWLQTIVVKEKGTAETIMGALKNGADFGRLARRLSRGMRAAQGGDAGWIAFGSLSAPLRRLVGTLQPRDTRGPLPHGAEFLIVRLQERRFTAVRNLAEARLEIERRLLPAAQHEAISDWLANQEKKSRIEIFPGP